MANKKTLRKEGFSLLLFILLRLLLILLLRIVALGHRKGALMCFNEGSIAQSCNGKKPVLG